MIENRKVQEIRGSYYIYLPKNWCEENGINKNRLVSIEILEDNSLLLTSINNSSPLTGQISINLDDWEHENTDILFLIFSSYICGADKIIIESKNKIKLPLRQEIDQMVRNLIDIEVLEESENKIVIRTLGQTPEDIKNMFNRILNNVLYMLEEISNIWFELSGKNKTPKISAENYNLKEIVDVIISRYKNVNRFSSFIERGIHILLRDRNLLRKLKWSTDDCIFNLMVTKYIERIGDHAAKLAELFLNLNEFNNIIDEIIRFTYNIYKESVVIYQFGNMLEAYKIFSNHSKDELLINQKNQLDECASDKLIIYHLQRIISYSKKIAEIAVHKFVSKTVASSRKYHLSKDELSKNII